MHRRPRRKDGLVREIASLWVIGGALVIASLLVLATLGLVLLARPGPAPEARSTAVLYVIAAPTVTATPVLETPFPTPPAGNIQREAFVQVTGTGGSGLRLRDQPGLSGKMLLLGSEAEIFRVSDGPVEADGYEWWFLVGPFDETRRGWAASNYLQVVQNP